MNNKGFTLTELLATITILGIVMTIGTVTYVSIQKNIRNEQTMDTFTTILNAAKTNFDMGVINDSLLIQDKDGSYQIDVLNIPGLETGNSGDIYNLMTVTIIPKSKTSIACFSGDTISANNQNLNELFDDNEYFNGDDKTGIFFDKCYCTTAVEAIENVELPDPEINKWQNVHN